MKREQTIVVDPHIEQRDVIVTRLDAAIDWIRKNS